MGLLSRYQHQIAHKHLHPDRRQQQVVRVLNAFAVQLEQSINARRWFFARRQAPKSLYLYGKVGRGKTMLMDLLYNTIKVQKRRHHFGEFMLWLHAELKHQQGKKNPLNLIASSIAKSTDLLCFDELQVNDIADAMLLGRFFHHLLDSGVVLCATSNQHPNGLYADGLQRERFVPVIQRIEQDFALIPLFDGSDYRRFDLLDSERYLVPANQTNREQILLELYRFQDDPPLADSVLLINGRPVTSIALFRHAKAAVFSFEALCATPRSSSDYLQLAQDWSIFALVNIPRMDEKHLDELHRFILLIDQLYERRLACLFTAEAPIDELYTGEKLRVSFARCASRLYSLQHHPIPTISP